MRKRNNEIHLRMTDEEAALLNSRAVRCGLTRQAYLLALLKNKEVKELPPHDFIAVLDSLERIGTNINQVAAKANTLGFIDKPMYEEQYEKLQKVIAELMRVAYS